VRKLLMASVGVLLLVTSAHAKKPYEIERDSIKWPATRLALWKCGIIWVRYWHRGSDVRELSFTYGYKPYMGGVHPKKLDLNFYWDNDGTSHATLNGKKCTEEDAEEEE
jgi:hypothetical protein